MYVIQPLAVTVHFIAFPWQTEETKRRLKLCRSLFEPMVVGFSLINASVEDGLCPPMVKAFYLNSATPLFCSSVGPFTHRVTIFSLALPFISSISLQEPSPPQPLLSRTASLLTLRLFVKLS